MKQQQFTCAAAALIVATLAMTGCGKSSTPRAEATLKNLQAAYEGESNANARYTAFAAQADKEGYGQVASLFRAAAKAESIHAANHAKVIRSMGAEPAAKIDAPKVGTTAENLAAAIKGESYERDTMYPEFLAKAKAEKSAPAVQTFTWAATAEAEHAKLYKLALDNLDGWRGDKKEFLVCTQCGYTTTQMDLTKCPSCSAPRDKIVVVS